MYKLLIILTLICQFLVGIRNLKWGMGIFLFVFVVFPSSEIPLFDFFTLTFNKSSILVALIVLLVHNSKGNVQKIENSKRYFRPIYIFSLFMLPSYMFSQFSEGEFRGIYLYFSYYFVDQLLPGIIILYSIKKEEDFIYYLKCIAMAVVTMGLFGLFEFITNNNPFMNWIRSFTDENKKVLIEYSEESRYGFSRRVQSTAWHPIAYGDCLSMYIILFFIPIITAYTNKRFRRISNYLYLIIILALINILLTASRTPWLAAAISIVFIQIYHIKDFFKRNFVFKVALVGIAIPITYLIVSQIASYLAKEEVSGSSVSMRMDQLTYILDSIGSSLYIGFGPSSIDHFYKTGSFAEALGFESILFVFLFYNGLLGIIGLSIVYYTCLKNLSIKNNKSFFKSFLIAIFISHFIAVMISGELRTFRVFWVLYSMLYAITEIQKYRSNRQISNEQLEQPKSVV